MTIKTIRVEIHGWYVTIEVRDVSKRPNWEVRVSITRMKEDSKEHRGHRFYVAPEVASKLKMDKWAKQKLTTVLSQGAKRVILREFDDIFSEPEGGLDSLRLLAEADLKSEEKKPRRKGAKTPSGTW
jgi:hypothetical protein